MTRKIRRCISKFLQKLMRCVDNIEYIATLVNTVFSKERHSDLNNMTAPFPLSGRFTSAAPTCLPLLLMVFLVLCGHSIELAYGADGDGGVRFILPASGNSSVLISGVNSTPSDGDQTKTLQVNGVNVEPGQLRSRHKRYVAFPEGSSFSVAFCATLGFVGNPQFIYFSWAINWGLTYELPNQTWILNHRNYKRPEPKPVVLRRQRRELYGRLETAIDNMGFDGRQCILRALCESTQYFFKRGSNMVEELLRSIFSLPKTKVLSFEHTDLLDYDSAHRKGQNRVFCPAAYPACSFSLIEMALGEYSKSAGYM